MCGLASGMVNNLYEFVFCKFSIQVKNECDVCVGEYAIGYGYGFGRWPHELDIY